MEGNDPKLEKHKNGIWKHVDNIPFVWQDNITFIDLSSRNIEDLDDKVKLPVNLLELNLSNNKLTEVPKVILEVKNVKVLNLSRNKIQYFDDYPNFCQSLESLDVSFNNLLGPPHWVWAESPQKLRKLDLSSNPDITRSFINNDFKELLQYTSLVTEVHLENCKLGKFTEIIACFPKAVHLCLGAEEYKYHSANSLLEVPCQGLQACHDVKRLTLCNTHVYSISPSIDIYNNLVQINLAFNNLNGLPNEFCNLKNLETCILSCNHILYLPEDIHKLEKLGRLYLDSNDLCMLPESIWSLVNLKILDVYNNNLNEIPDDLSQLEELDLAQNYFDEPENSEYFEKKERIRLTHENRYNGRKEIVNKSDEYSDIERSIEDDEELHEIFNNEGTIDVPAPFIQSSSPEDWDSDEHWVPCHQTRLPSGLSPWLCFVKQKMKEGHFCPMDAHTVSIAEKVIYERKCRPQVNHESDGQFDDYSSDNS